MLSHGLTHYLLGSTCVKDSRETVGRNINQTSDAARNRSYKQGTRSVRGTINLATP